MLKRGVPTPSDVQKFVRCIGVDIRTRANLKLSLNPKISCPDPISKIFLLDALMCDDLDTARQYVPFVKNCLIPQNDDLHSLIAGFNHATKRAFRPPTFAFDVLGDLLTKLLQLPEDRGEDQGEDKNRLSQYRSLLADVLWESGKYNESISVGEKLVDQLERAVPRERARPIWHLAATSVLSERMVWLGTDDKTFLSVAHLADKWSRSFVQQHEEEASEMATNTMVELIDVLFRMARVWKIRSNSNGSKKKRNRNLAAAERYVLHASHGSKVIRDFECRQRSKRQNHCFGKNRMRCSKAEGLSPHLHD